MSFKEYAQTKSAEDVLAWNAYERGNPAYIKNERKIADAKKAIEAFGADKVPFDEAKFEAHYGASASKITRQTHHLAQQQKTNVAAHQLLPVGLRGVVKVVKHRTQDGLSGHSTSYQLT